MTKSPRCPLAAGLLLTLLVAGCGPRVTDVEHTEFMKGMTPLGKNESIGFVFDPSQEYRSGYELESPDETQLCVASELEKIGPEIPIVQTNTVLASLGLGSSLVPLPNRIRDALYRDEVRKEIQALKIRYIIVVGSPITGPDKTFYILGPDKTTKLDAWIIRTTQPRIIGDLHTKASGYLAPSGPYAPDVIFPATEQAVCRELANKLCSALRKEDAGTGTH